MALSFLNLNGSEAKVQPSLLILLLCIVEACERFANFYILPTLAKLIATRQGIPLVESIAAYYGTYTAASYLLNPVGAYIGERTNSRKVVIFGLVFLLCGYIGINLYARGYHTLYPTLAILALGHCLFKPNITASVKYISQLFGYNDEQQLSIFKKFYMAINIGAVSSGGAMLLFLEKYAYIPCVLGILASLIMYLVIYKQLRINADSAISIALRDTTIVQAPVETHSTGKMLLFIGLAMIFWISNLQMNTTIYRLSEVWLHNKAEAFTNINAAIVAVIILFSIGPKSEKAQMRLAYFLSMFGFAIISIIPNMIGIVLWYVCNSAAEVYISPVGQNYILSTARKHKIVLLGVWFTAISLAYKLSSYLPKLVETVGYTKLFVFNTALLTITGVVFARTFGREERENHENVSETMSTSCSGVQSQL